MNEKLRVATLEDVNLLFEWANEEEVRKNSFSTEKIIYENHVTWFQNLLKKENCRQYIYCVDGVSAGQVRVTVEGDKAEIGYSICASQRRKGYAKNMLQLLKIQMKQDFPNVNTLVAKVKPENLASQKVFLGLGYEEKYRQYEIEI